MDPDGLFFCAIKLWLILGSEKADYRISYSSMMSSIL